MSYFLHAANILFVFSYMVRDMLKLRALTLIAGVSLMGFYVTTQPPLASAIAWNVVFLSINGRQLWRRLAEVRPPKLTVAQRRLHGLAFSSLRERDFVHLVAAGTWETLEAGARLITPGMAPDRLRVIVDGGARVTADDVTLDLGAGQLIGEMAFLTGRPATVTVEALTELRCFTIPFAAAERALGEREELRVGLQRLISRNLVTKLRFAPQSSLPSPQVALDMQPG